MRRQVQTPTRRRWRMPWPQLIACLVMFGGIAVILYPQVASWFSQREQSHAIEAAQAQLNDPPLNDPNSRRAELARAHAYNDALSSGAIYEANANVATGDGSSADQNNPYNEILNLAGGGFMGRLRYDSLGIDLPIYHGTSDKTLEKGVGHLEGTSLPVGGIGTRSVLTAHRGLPEATLFNNLNESQVGDTFAISVLDEVLTYKVVEVQVVEPDETHAILAVPDRDLVTLVTCTPLGINSHRILVTAERVTPTPTEDVEAATAVPHLPNFPWWSIILAGSFTALAIYVGRAGIVRTGDDEDETVSADA
ncbi:class C sortase [Flaviflexus huanghaiensis]|uniref:class C sortase n=1 Tax=Flaviflexus huanghaiensis TaxID=1111473 RepID=UPI0019D58CEE|nr:class C sortase [Flaviflexus huanghaiensis]